ncbi:fibronectin type III domain-containing protein [Patiriisocius hiemis]|uniref:Fibronectin type III domain-containing protein n=1 Tax=Patiriisocius hiemis TaxID=3075604 RepID=A0ABU2YCC4_9FLAO|nr:fibronectin type III domain-containing protein [Constantimarinum sp. W242]MDT0555828.1 fibronectin type III domain-containing protein [Constantimarinum sp. W242]
MKNLPTLLLLLFATVLSSCGGDDDYSPTETNDTEAPSAPANLTASNETESSIDISWDASTDNVGVIGYKVFQDGIEIASNVSGTSYTALNLDFETTYSYSVIAFDAAGNESNTSNTIDATTIDAPFGFRDNLSQMGVYVEDMATLTPSTGVQLYEINTTLFTDYSKKQRLIKLPDGETLTYNGDDLLPSYPDETLIAKTFFYNIDDRDPSLGKTIIETRIFLKINGVWEVGDYIWNESQTDATYTENSSQIAISFIDEDGDTNNIDYVIPSKQDCFTCHNNNSTPIPIGMKLRSMNFTPSYTGGQNQLDFFINNGLLEGLGSSSEVSVLPDWTDTANYDIFERGRAYLDVNCAHCHRPGSTTPPEIELDLRLETPYADTKIYEKRSSIEARFSSVIAGYSMPLIGRTVVHEEALTMLMDYLSQISEP